MSTMLVSFVPGLAGARLPGVPGDSGPACPAGSGLFTFSVGFLKKQMWLVIKE